MPRAARSSAADSHRAADNGHLDGAERCLGHRRRSVCHARERGRGERRRGKQREPERQDASQGSDAAHGASMNAGALRGIRQGESASDAAGDDGIAGAA